jgi:NADH-quinone oxidoreductase subunit M
VTAAIAPFHSLGPGQTVLWLVLAPWIGTLFTWWWRGRPAPVVRAAVLTNALITAGIATWLAASGHSAADGTPALQLEWLALARVAVDGNPTDPWLRVVFSLGCDALNAGPLLWIPWLTVSVVLLAEDAPPAYWGALCAWEACLLGAFAAYDACTFLLFDTAALGLAAVLGGVWGGEERRAATGRFWRHQFAGQVAWTAGLIALGVVAAWCRGDVLPANPPLEWTWRVLAVQLPRSVAGSWGAAQYWESVSSVLLAWLVVGAAIRSPLMPLHAWWPRWAREAPAGVAALTAAAWCPLGLYGWLRFVSPVFSTEIMALRNGLAFFSGMTAVGGALLALAQTDRRRLAAYAGLSGQGVAWLSTATVSSAGARAALELSLAVGWGTAIWLLGTALLEECPRCHLPVAREQGLLRCCPRRGWVWSAALFAFLGFPSLGRLRADFLVVWQLAQNNFWGLGLALVSAVIVGWGATWSLQALLFGQPDPTRRRGEHAPREDHCGIQAMQAHPSRDELHILGDSYRVEDRPPLTVDLHTSPAANDLTRAQAWGLIPLAAWCVWSWCQPLPAPAANISTAATQALGAREPAAAP